jgi:two-component system sensor histidine kinase TctE
MPRSRSLQARLLIWLLLPLAVVLPLRAWVQYEQTVGQTNDAFDEGLADTALALADLVQWDDGAIRFALSAQTEHWLRTDQNDTLYIAVLGPDRRTVAGDVQLASVALERPSAGVLIRWLRRLAALPHQPATDLRGVRFYDTRVRVGTQLQPVRLALKRVACGPVECEVRVAETLLKRERIEREALQGTVGFFLALVAIEVLIIVLAVRMSFAPLRRLSDELAGRASDDLRPLPATDVPAELHPFIQATNGLFARVREASAAQQAFIADAAHQLRTPLTALRTEAELALLEQPDGASTAALQRIHAAAERTARLAAQLLAQARSDAGAHGLASPERVDLRQVAEQAAEDWVPQAVRQGVDLGFQLEAAPVAGHAYLLRELLGNLIHNALVYAPLAHARPEDTHITVRTHRQADACVLEVEDNGPGIPAAERERVLQRFQRGSHGTGSGLGLAIVRDIVSRHGGELQLLDGAAGRGLCVRVRLRPA